MGHTEQTPVKIFQFFEVTMCLVTLIIRGEKILLVQIEPTPTSDPVDRIPNFLQHPWFNSRRPDRNEY